MTRIFLEKLLILSTDKTIRYIEYSTREQSNSELWFNMRKGRLTASKHHDIYTKINTLARSTGAIKPKTTPLVSKILYKNKSLSKVAAIRWGTDHEAIALKSFYAQEVGNHQEFKTEKSGLFISRQQPFIAASPDGFMSCKCHGRLPLEIKCPFKIKDKTVKEGVEECNFLTLTSEGTVTINKNHKYYTQIISQMAVTNSKQAVFIVWTSKEGFHILHVYAAVIGI